jgi:hypothetical protein
MADGFIVRRGGRAADQTATPSILDFSTVSATSIKFKLRNNDAATATLVYRFGTVTGEGDSISVAANTTTSEITLTVPTITAPTKLFVTANATGKVKSEIAEQEFEVPIVYTAATGGTTEDYNLDGKRYRSHTFTSDGNFVVTTVGDATDDRNKVDYLIIAGGGGGGTAGGVRGAGGGGAGGYRTTLGTSGRNSAARTKITVTEKTYGVVIGAGGNGVASESVSGLNGTASTFDNISTVGGGGGGAANQPGTATPGGNGGSGGGAGARNTNRGLGTTDEGFDGGVGVGGDGSDAGGGGGGASENGQDKQPGVNIAGKGGDGLANLLRTGLNETRAGGGGGGAREITLTSPGVLGDGGAGGGGAGSNERDKNGENGVPNTGSGGGGSSAFSTSPFISVGGNGGSGIVIIRYEIAPSV